MCNRNSIGNNRKQVNRTWENSRCNNGMENDTRYGMARHNKWRGSKCQGNRLKDGIRNNITRVHRTQGNNTSTNITTGNILNSRRDNGICIMEALIVAMNFFKRNLCSIRKNKMASRCSTRRNDAFGVLCIQTH